MMIYNEKLFGTATTVTELIDILTTGIPQDATVDVASIEHCADVEVWYDEDTNTVILK